MEPIISIKNLQKKYGETQVLNGINLDIFPGQVIGYIGPNGAGKSTTVKILCSLISDFTGTVTVKGHDVVREPLAVKSIIGYVPEVAELYDVLTPNEFLEFVADLHDIPREVARERIVRMLTVFGIERNADQRMDTFSKGMKQKVLLTSGLLHNPEIIILDEPLSGLDANNVIIIKEIISRLAREGRTIFYCSHMMDVVEKVSDRIVLIDKGNVIADGSIEELKKKQGDISLEKIFADLTSSDSLGAAADSLMNMFDNKQN